MNDNSEILQADGFQVEVIRTDRKKTLSVKVLAGRVEVRVPRATSANRVADLVTRKARWIREKLLQQQSRQPQLVKRYVTGERFEFLGEEVMLRVEVGADKHVTLANGVLRVQVPNRVRKREQYVGRAVQEWFRAAAAAQLPARIDHYAALVGVAPRAIKVRRYKARWGSCSSRGELAFNWLIMAAPTTIADYVVVHELCHLLHLNHGEQFWATVERAMPDYRQHRQWLRVNGWQLVV